MKMKQHISGHRSTNRVLSKEETAVRLNVKPKSLGDKRFLQRIGLPAVKIGSRIGFYELDIERFINTNREKLAVPTGGRHGS